MKQRALFLLIASFGMMTKAMNNLVIDATLRDFFGGQVAEEEIPVRAAELTRHFLTSQDGQQHAVMASLLRLYSSCHQKQAGQMGASVDWKKVATQVKSQIKLFEKDRSDEHAKPLVLLISQICGAYSALGTAERHELHRFVPQINFQFRRAKQELVKARMSNLADMIALLE